MTKEALEMIGHNVQKYRKKAGLRQDDLAEHLKVSAQTISRIENGVTQCSIETLLSIAECIAVSPNVLLEGVYDKKFIRYEDYLQEFEEELYGAVTEKIEEEFQRLLQEQEKRDAQSNYRVSPSKRVAEERQRPPKGSGETRS